MGKYIKAMEAQQYTPKFVAGTCGNCTHLRFEMKLAAWLENEAETSKGLVVQLEKLGPIGTPMIKREMSEAAAALLIASKLRSTLDN